MMRTALVLRHVVPVALLLAISPASASTKSADAKVERASAVACVKAAGLLDAQAGTITRFSDKFGVDVRPVMGRWPQPHMRGQPLAQMYCIYDRRTGRVEVQEQPAVSR